MNKNKLIPELRFPEFGNIGEWEVKELSELGELINGLTYSPNDIREKGLLVLRSSNIQDGLIDLKDCVYVRTDIKGANLSAPKDILVCVRNGSKDLIGKNAIIPQGIPFATHGAFMTVFRAKNPEFVFQLFQTNFYDTQVKADLGATINSINGKNFLKYEFPVPTLPKEQQKIASCLSSLNEVIAAHCQKLELLKDHKKGLMQNLFPQMSGTGFSGLKDEQDEDKILSVPKSCKSCSDKVPKYRFKEFENDGEWVEKKLGDLGYFLGGGTPERSNSSYWIGDIPWISSSDTKDDDIHNISITRFINDNAIKESATKLIPKGSVLFVSRVGVGKLAINKVELCTSQDFTSFVPNKDVLNFFIGYYFSSNKNLLQSLNQGTSIKGFSKSDLENFMFKYPKNPKEQQKIASCLSSLDAFIAAQTDKIEQLKLHKKGLMQGLFPVLNPSNSIGLESGGN